MLNIGWTSPRPFGVGTTRTARALGGLLIIREQFFRWEEGRRKSFTTLDASAPLYRRLGEDYIVEPTSPDRCRFTWTLGIEPTPLGRVVSPVTALLIRSLMRDTRRHFTRRPPTAAALSGADR